MDWLYSWLDFILVWHGDYDLYVCIALAAVLILLIINVR